MKDSIDPLKRFHEEELRQQFLACRKTLVIVDDDPTGTQTVFDVPVLGDWTEEAFIFEFKAETPLFFVLGNTRSLTQEMAVKRAEEIGNNLRRASEKTGREFLLVSRSDSTLRGHFPAEVDAIRQASGREGDPVVIAPGFFEGGRITENDIHYIVENGNKIPVAETSFARDKYFGYENSDLKKWVEEKSNQAIKAETVRSLSINEIEAGEKSILEKLGSLKEGELIVINSTGYKELEWVCLAFHRLIKEGKSYVFRTAASFISAFAGIGPKAWVPDHSTRASDAGGLIVVGSYVPKTTAQLGVLLSNKTVIPIPLLVSKLVKEEDFRKTILSKQVKEIEDHLSEGRHVVIYTSRELITGANPEENLAIGKLVTEFLVELVSKIKVNPAFILAKGGITSNDLAVGGLGMKRAMVLGQIIPGVPVWELGAETRFPNTPYVVFPGNVGDDNSLNKVFELFTIKARVV